MRSWERLLASPLHGRSQDGRARAAGRCLVVLALGVSAVACGGSSAPPREATSVSLAPTTETTDTEGSASPTSPIVEIRNPCARTVDGTVGCWGDAGGGPRLRVVATDTARLVHIQGQTCWQRSDGAYRCPANCDLCAGALQQNGVVDVDGDLALFEDGRVVAAGPGEPRELRPASAEAARRLVELECRDRQKAWAILDGDGTLRGDPDCEWTTTWPWSGVRSVAGGEQLLCALLEERRVRCALTRPAAAWAVAQSIDEQGFLPVDDVVGFAAHRRAVCTVEASGRVQCAGFDPQPGDENDRRTLAIVEGLGAREEPPVIGVHDYAGAELCVTSAGAIACNGLGVSVPFRAHPVAIPEVNDAVEVVEMYDGYCARTGDGELWCWGDEIRRMNDGSTARFPPTRVATGVTALGTAHMNLYWLADGGLFLNGTRIASTEGTRLEAGLVKRRSREQSIACVLGGARPSCWEGSGSRIELPGRLVDASVDSDAFCVVLANGRASCRDIGRRWHASEQFELEGTMPPVREALEGNDVVFVGESATVRCRWDDDDYPRGMRCRLGPEVGGPNRRVGERWWRDEAESIWRMDLGQELLGVEGVRDLACSSGCVVADGGGRVHVLGGQPYRGTHGSFGLFGRWTPLPWEGP